MKRYIQSSTLIQKFNKDPFKAFSIFLNQASGVEGFDEDNEVFSIYCDCTADDLRDQFATYLNDTAKVSVDTGYDDEIDQSYNAVIIKPTADKWRQIIFNFEDVPEDYEYGENVWVNVEDVF